MSSKSTLSREVSSERDQIFDSFRRWGYLDASLNPPGGIECISGGLLS